MRAKRGFAKEVAELKKEARQVESEITHFCIIECCTHPLEKSKARLDTESRLTTIHSRLKEITTGEWITAQDA